MKYSSLKLSFQERITGEIAVARLAEIGFDTFEEVPEGLVAYIPTENYSESEIAEVFVELLALEHNITMESSVLEEKNWNETWESSFQPVLIESVGIRAPFHQPLEGTSIDLIIEPKMSFGTGHHETTSMMVKLMRGLNLVDKKVLDMGCGTGVLAILAAKLGSTAITAIDIDEWAYENALENIALNGCETIDVRKGTMEDVKDICVDVLLANINRNIISKDLSSYAEALSGGGILLLSGFLRVDADLLVSQASENGLSLVNTLYTNEWTALQLIKN